MKKQQLFIYFIFFICGAPALYGQESLQVLYNHYTMGFKIQTELLINQDQMLYTRRQEADKRVSKEGFQFFLPEERFSWLMDRASRQLKITRGDSEYEFYSRSLDELVWDIQEETAKIKGFKVQKAVAKPLGSRALYTSSGEVIAGEDDVAIAWFANALPFNGGPEGYYGLPGLILKLEYSGGNDYFIADSISYQDNIEITDLDGEGMIEVPYIELMNFSLIDKKWLRQQKKLLKSGKKK